MKMFKLVVAMMVGLVAFGLAARGEDAAKPEEAKKAPEQPAAAAAFGTVEKSDAAYTGALDAHDLDGLKQKADQEAAFKGTVSGTYEPNGAKLLIVNFDKQFKNAVSAVIKGGDISKLPDVKALVGKEVLVTGKVTLHRERPEIVVSDAGQIKLVQ